MTEFSEISLQIWKAGKKVLSISYSTKAGTFSAIFNASEGNIQFPSTVAA